VQDLAVCPVDGGEEQSGDRNWEEEPSATVDIFDKRLLQHESDVGLTAVAAETRKSLKVSSVS
jgi:hypothetical protein